MKTNLNRKTEAIFFTILLLLAIGLNTDAQKVETLILYENFGGFAAAGSSEDGIEPAKWPSVIADSGEYSGWDASLQKLDSKNATDLVYQFYSNKTFHIDSVVKYRDAGLPAGISVNNTTKRWYKATPFLEGYQTPGENNTSMEIRFWGATVLPDFLSWMSYGANTPDFIKNQTDEKGYIYLAKDISSGDRAVVTLPNSDFDYLKDISRLEIMFSGSRLGHNNTLSVRVQEVDNVGLPKGSTTYTYSASIEPRVISVPVNKAYCRIFLQGWGSANNGNVTDYALSNSNTEVDLSYAYNYNAIAGTKPDASETAGQTGNPGISIHMIKMYALMDKSGYTIKTDNALVTGTKTGIAHGTSTTLTAAATNGSGKKFMGWNIDGKDDLSEVVNPLTIAVNKDNMTIMPVYVGDTVELPVINENFTNWKQAGNTDPAKNNLLDFNQGTPNETVISGTFKVPFRYGFTSSGEDSLELTLKACNVISNYGLRVHNLPGWENLLGYIAFMGPNTDKGYVSLGSIDSISKAVITLSNYDQPNPDRACAILVNDSVVRNK